MSKENNESVSPNIHTTDAICSRAVDGMEIIDLTSENVEPTPSTSDGVITVSKDRRRVVSETTDLVSSHQQLPNVTGKNFNESRKRKLDSSSNLFKSSSPKYAKKTLLPDLGTPKTDALKSLNSAQASGISASSRPNNNVINTFVQTGSTGSHHNASTREIGSSTERTVPVAGCSRSTNLILRQLLEIFPEMDHHVLGQYCDTGLDLNEIVNIILEINKKISETLEKREYPKLVTRVTNEVKKEDDNIINDVGLYTVSFDVNKFLSIFPDPFHFFLVEERNCQHSAHAAVFLKRRYAFQSAKVIDKCYRDSNYNLSRTCEKLDNEKEATRHTKRRNDEIYMPIHINIPFLQEACFVEHKEEIREHLNRIGYEKAKTKTDLVDCGCCYDQVMFEDCATCNDGCLFCKTCIKKSAEVRIGDGLTSFPCLLACGAELSLQLLQKLLDARVFSRLLQRIQLEEVRAADIEGLEMCPFCEFAYVPPPETNIFVCLNPECLKESCRKCHKISHIPLRCEEVENDDQARARKYIEDEMTKALVRECYKCKKSFIKVEGCNKMTCTCGAKMCYICRQPVKDYKHFDRSCPLFSNINYLHVDAVKERGDNALREVTEQNPNLNLKHDPTQYLPSLSDKTKNIMRRRRNR